MFSTPMDVRELLLIQDDCTTGKFTSLPILRPNSPYSRTDPHLRFLSVSLASLLGKWRYGISLERDWFPDSHDLPWSLTGVILYSSKTGIHLHSKRDLSFINNRFIPIKQGFTPSE